MRRLRSEDLYDAILDDDLFASVPSLVASSYDARSTVLHWRHEDDGAEVLAHSGYYSDAQLADYADNFAAHDPWVLAARAPDRVNSAVNLESLVPTRSYERTEFYNEWIRAMGDDTYHCMGIVVETGWGAGIVGIHRGKTQAPFDGDVVRALGADVVHLRRMLAIRGKLSAAHRTARSVAGMLDAIGHAVMSVTAGGRLVHANAAAEALFRRADGLSLRDGKLTASSPRAQSALSAAFARALAREGGEASALAVERADGGAYHLGIVGIQVGNEPRRIVITASDPDAEDSGLATRLRSIFNLTLAEAAIAARLASGDSLKEISVARQVALDTVRAQLKSITAKMGCQRQAEVIVLAKGLLPMSGPR